MFEVKLKGRPNEDLVRGFPGLPATWPRIEGTLEIRPAAKDLAKEQRPLGVTKVTVGLYRTDSATPSGNKPTLSGKKERSYLVTRQKDLWSSTREVYGLDLPFILSLPTKVAASFSAGKMAETVYYMFVSVTCPTAKVPVDHRTFPVGIKCFGTLSTLGTYQQPLNGEAKSSDHYVTLEYRVPQAAYGPGDTVNATVTVGCNLDWPKARKARLRRISLELVQVISFSIPETETVPDKRLRVCKTAKEYGDVKLGDGPQSCELALDIPGLHLEGKDGIVAKESAELPDEGRIGFTTSCSLYKVEFELIFKARFSHARDIETSQKLTISQFDSATSLVYMHSGLAAAELTQFADKRAPSPTLCDSPLDTGVEIR